MNYRDKPCSVCEDCNLCETATNQSEEARLVSIVRDTVRRVLDQQTTTQPGFELTVGVSARHLHITEEDLAAIYGPGHPLTPMRDLAGPGEFASEETVTLVGPNMRAIQGVRILGPCRSKTQVELASTDGVYLGISLPMRASGDVAGSAAVTIIGPHGALYLSEGTIRADRHIHISPEEAARYGVANGQRIQVEVSGPAGLIFNQVRIRINEGFSPPAMHIDTDDGNAASVRCGDAVRVLL
jgi:putative phosphotransacetylase